MVRYTKKELFSIPNIMGYFRILLVPVFMVLFLSGRQLAAAIVAGVSCLTDFFDGKIARRFHMITNFGKLLDPIADKLTQAALAFCLATEWPLIWLVAGLLVLKELYMAIAAVYMLKRYDVVLNGALWYGKVCTFAFDFVMFLLLFLPPFHVTLPPLLIDLLLYICMALMVLSAVLYAFEYRRLAKSK